MSQLQTIADCKKLPDMCPIKGISGTVNRAKPVDVGQSQHGEWTRQNFSLQDGEEWIAVKIWGVPKDRPFKDGDHLIVTAIEGRKKPGMKMEVQQKGDKTYTTLVINHDSTQIKVGGNGSSAHEDAPQSAGNAQPAQSAPKAHDLAHVKLEVLRTCALYDICRSAVDTILKPAPEDRREVITTIFIQATREGLLRSMPARLPGKEPEAPKEPDWLEQLREKFKANQDDEDQVIKNLVAHGELDPDATAITPELAKRAIQDSDFYEMICGVPF